jgi:hypothetical protein
MNRATRSSQALLERYIKHSLEQLGIKEGSNSKPGDGNYSAVLGKPKKPLIFNK